MLYVRRSWNTRIWLYSDKKKEDAVERRSCKLSFPLAYCDCLTVILPSPRSLIHARDAVEVIPRSEYYR